MSHDIHIIWRFDGSRSLVLHDTKVGALGEGSFGQVLLVTDPALALKVWQVVTLGLSKQLPVAFGTRTPQRFTQQGKTSEKNVENMVFPRHCQLYSILRKRGFRRELNCPATLTTVCTLAPAALHPRKPHHCPVQKAQQLKHPDPKWNPFQRCPAKGNSGVSEPNWSRGSFHPHSNGSRSTAGLFQMLSADPFQSLGFAVKRSKAGPSLHKNCLKYDILRYV